MTHLPVPHIFIGYFGTNCTDVCALNPCEHESMCTRKLTSLRGYTCDCPNNYFGHYCEKKYSFCISVKLHMCVRWEQFLLDFIFHESAGKLNTCFSAGQICRAPEGGGVTKPAAPAAVRQIKVLTLTATRPVESVAVRWVCFHYSVTNRWVFGWNATY